MEQKKRTEFPCEEFRRPLWAFLGIVIVLGTAMVVYGYIWEAIKNWSAQ